MPFLKALKRLKGNNDFVSNGDNYYIKYAAFVYIYIYIYITMCLSRIYRHTDIYIYNYSKQEDILSFNSTLLILQYI